MNTHEGQNQDPRPVGDILAEVVDINSRTIRRDTYAEYQRKQIVADRLIGMLREQRSGYIEDVRNGQDEAVAAVTVASAELHHVMANRVILQLNAPPVHP